MCCGDSDKGEAEKEDNPNEGTKREDKREGGGGGGAEERMRDRNQRQEGREDSRGTELITLMRRVRGKKRERMIRETVKEAVLGWEGFCLQKLYRVSFFSLPAAAVGDAAS